MNLVFSPQNLQFFVLWMNGARYGLTMGGSLYFMNENATLLFMQIIISFAFGPLFF